MSKLSGFAIRTATAILVVGGFAIGVSGVADAAPTGHGARSAVTASGLPGAYEFGPYESFKQCDNWWVQESNEPNWVTASNCVNPDGSGWTFWAEFS